MDERFSEYAPYRQAARRRFACTIPLSVSVMTLILIEAALIRPNLPPPPEFNAVEARLIELAPPPKPAGLQGGAAPATAPKPRRRPAPPPSARKAEAAPPIKKGEVTIVTVPAPAGPSSGSKGAAEEGGVAGGTGIGSGRGLGNDSAGARAIYAPIPKIPDDLREESFKAIAIAHFRVLPDGTVQVSLATPTSNPRLNQILLATLEQWRFFPAMRDGVAVLSEFDVRIPIAVE